MLDSHSATMPSSSSGRMRAKSACLEGDPTGQIPRAAKGGVGDDPPALEEERAHVREGPGRHGVRQRAVPLLQLPLRHLRQGTSQRHEIVECSRLANGQGRITLRVTSCTAYSDRRLPSLYDMQDMAWVLRSDPKRNQVGFVRPRDLRIREPIFFDEE